MTKREKNKKGQKDNDEEVTYELSIGEKHIRVNVTAGEV